MTKEQLEAKLREQIAAGDITPDDAEDEYQQFVRRFENTFEGVYGW